MIVTIEVEVSREGVPPWIYTIDMAIPDEAQARDDLEQMIRRQVREDVAAMGLKLHQFVSLSAHRVVYEGPTHG